MACVPLSSARPSLASRTSGAMPAARMASAPDNFSPLINRFAFTDYHLREMRERREVAGSAD